MLNLNQLSSAHTIIRFLFTGLNFLRVYNILYKFIYFSISYAKCCTPSVSVENDRFLAGATFSFLNP